VTRHCAWRSIRSPAPTIRKFQQQSFRSKN